MKGIQLTSQLILKQTNFFPIIKNIDIDVTMMTSSIDRMINFDIHLEKIELNATREEFINLLNVKKFIIGEEDDQLQLLEEHRKAK